MGWLPSCCSPPAAWSPMGSVHWGGCALHDGNRAYAPTSPYATEASGASPMPSAPRPCGLGDANMQPPLALQLPGEGQAKTPRPVPLATGAAAGDPCLAGAAGRGRWVRGMLLSYSASPRAPGNQTPAMWGGRGWACTEGEAEGVGRAEQSQAAREAARAGRGAGVWSSWAGGHGTGKRAEGRRKAWTGGQILPSPEASVPSSHPAPGPMP